MYPSHIKNVSIKTIEPAQAKGPVAESRLQRAHIRGLCADAQKTLQAGGVRDFTDELNFGDVSPQLDASGKTIVANKWRGLIVGSTLGKNGHTIVTAADANKSAKQGAATHGFFYENTDFLMDAAQLYSALGENESFKFRDINDSSFVKNTRDFFTNGNFTEADVVAVQEQMNDVVMELAQQIKSGREPDLNSLKSTRIIGGENVSISQILDFQETGKMLASTFDQIFVG